MLRESFRLSTRHGQCRSSAGDLASTVGMPVVVMATESTGSGRAEDADSASGGWHGLHKVSQCK
jgi:hypothetical protein